MNLIVIKKFISYFIRHFKKNIKLTLMFFSLLGFNCANAASCRVGDIYSTTGWRISDVNSIENGSIVGVNQFSYPVDIESLSKDNGFFLYTTINKSTSDLSVMPLDTVPGLGVRWTWGRYQDISNAALSPAAPGVIRLGNGSTTIIDSKFTQEASQRKIILDWVVELVIIDKKAYAGGMVDLSRDDLSINIGQFMKINGSLSTCNIPFLRLEKEFFPGATLAVPELPKPPTPTCQFPFHSYTQNVDLPSSPIMMISDNAASRDKGAYGQAVFMLNAQNCGADTKFEMYFTDNNVRGEVKDYLVTTGDLAGKVGLRLYAGQKGQPIVFGPAPTGSTPAIQPPAISEGPTPEGSSFVYPITAQYVRLPGVSITDLKPGQLNAQAVVTVVYP